MRDDPRSTEMPGEDTLSALYALTRDAEHTPRPDDRVEAAILAAARAAGMQHSPARSHMVRWASAAVLVLAVGLAWQIERADTGLDGAVQRKASSPASLDVPAKDMPERDAVSSTSSIPVDDGVRMEAIETRSNETQVSAGAVAEIPAAPAARADAPREKSAAPVVAAPPAGLLQIDASGGLAPLVEIAPQYSRISLEDPRIAPVRALLAEGRVDEARALLRRLRAEDPRLELDEPLRALLAMPDSP